MKNYILIDPTKINEEDQFLYEEHDYEEYLAKQKKAAEEAAKEKAAAAAEKLRSRRRRRLRIQSKHRLLAEGKSQTRRRKSRISLLAAVRRVLVKEMKRFCFPDLNSGGKRIGPISCRENREHGESRRLTSGLEWLGMSFWVLIIRMFMST